MSHVVTIEEPQAKPQVSQTRFGGKSGVLPEKDNAVTHLRAEYLDKGASPSGTVIKNPPANAGDARDTSSIPGSDRKSVV